MTTELTKTQWIEILLNEEISNELDISIFQALFSFEKHQAPASQIGMILGYNGKNPAGVINLEIGRYAKRIAKYYDINFTQRSFQKFKFWDLFFNGWDEGKFFIWQLKDELIEALNETELTGEIQYPEEIPLEQNNSFTEGIRKTITVNTYERNPKARQECLKYWKAICSVCDFDFGNKYGELGKGFIHVHHLIPVSEIGKSYQVDPINDLRPVCPNCHSMIHKKNPPIEINELKEIIKKTTSK